MADDSVTNMVRAATRQRLQPADEARQLKPFLRARELEDVLLLWAPVDRFPMNSEIRTWWMAFMDR